MKPKKHIKYYDGTKKKCREYYELNDKLHRENGPASIHYYESGNIGIEYYCIDGEDHREDGPARIWYYENGNIRSEYYYINGKELTKEQFIRKRDSKIFDKLLEDLANNP